MKLKILLTLPVLALILSGCAKVATNNKADLTNQLTQAVNTQTQTETPTEMQNNLNQLESSDWQTYTNNRYQYSIKYPTGWYVDTTYSENDFTQRGPVEDSDYIAGDTIWSNYQNPRQFNPGTIPSDYRDVSMLIYKTDVNSTLDEFISHFDYQNKSEININGLAAVELSGHNNPENYGDAEPRVILIKNQDKVFVFSPAYGAKESGIFMNQMVKTFKIQ